MQIQKNLLHYIAALVRTLVRNEVRNENNLHACSQTSMVRRGIEPSSVSGQSAPMVFVTFRPEGVYTSHAHPDPKAVAPSQQYRIDD